MTAASVAALPTPPLPVVVDASVWVARYVPTDAFHTASASWLRTQLRARRTLISPVLLLPELAGSVARVLSDTVLGLRVARSTVRLSRVRLVPIDAALAVSAYRLAAAQRLRGADAVYAALAQQLGLQLVSWDREQIARAGAVTPWPSEAADPPSTSTGSATNGSAREGGRNAVSCV